MPPAVQPNGMTAAAATLAYLERRQQVLANNLANVSTPGFKGERAFARLMDNAVAAVDTKADLSAGTMTPTGNALDLAIDGDGFFVLDTARGERLVRGGSFRLDADRRLVDREGQPLLGESGPIAIPAALTGTPEIGADGTVRVAGRLVGTLRVERLAPDARPEHEDGVRFLPDASRTAVPLAERGVKAGHIEESNVNPLEAMTAMLEVLHRYGAAQQTVSALDAVRGIAVNDLGKPV